MSHWHLLCSDVHRKTLTIRGNVSSQFAPFTRPPVTALLYPNLGVVRLENNDTRDTYKTNGGKIAQYNMAV